MPYKQITFGSDARDRIARGVDTIADAVAATLGPSGRTVLVERGYGFPLATKDGVTVAKEVRLKDNFEELGAAMVRQASSKTNDVSGDGTTTSAVITQAIFRAGLKKIRKGADPVSLARGISAAAEAVAGKLSDLAKKAEEDDLIAIAKVSANDDSLGGIVADAVIEAGTDGAITVEEGRAAKTTWTKVEGYSIDKPLVSPYLVTDAARGVAEHSDCAVIVSMDKLNDIRNIVNLLGAAKYGKKKDALLIVADDFSEDFVSLAVANHLSGSMKMALVKAPEFGETRKEYLLDIAAIVGCKPFGKEIGVAPQDIKDGQEALAYVGEVKKAVVTRDNAVIIEGAGPKDDVEKRIEAVRNLIEKEESEYQRTALKKRLAKLTGGVVTVRVGGQTETEMKERKYRVEDAVNAVRAASLDGYLPGGGTALIKAAKACEADMTDADWAGKRIVLDACRVPFRRILTNAGASESVAERWSRDFRIEGFEFVVGPDARTMLLADLELQGIIDPLTVAKNALLNACSCAATLLTVEAAVVIKKEPGEDNPLPPGYGNN